MENWGKNPVACSSLLQPAADCILVSSCSSAGSLYHREGESQRAGQEDMAILSENQGCPREAGMARLAPLASCAGTHLWYNPGHNPRVCLQFNGRQPSDDCAALL